MLMLDKPRLTGLARYLSRQGPPMTHTEALTHVAKGLGFPSLNACLATLKEPGTPRVFLPSNGWQDLLGTPVARTTWIESQVKEWLPPMPDAAYKVNKVRQNIRSWWSVWLEGFAAENKWMSAVEPHQFVAWVDYYAQPIQRALNVGAPPVPNAVWGGLNQSNGDAWQAAYDVFAHCFKQNPLSQPLSRVAFGMNPLDLAVLPPWGTERDRYIKTLTTSLIPTPQGFDSFWIQQAQALLFGIIVYLLAKQAAGLEPVGQNVSLTQVCQVVEMIVINHPELLAAQESLVDQSRSIPPLLMYLIQAEQTIVTLRCSAPPDLIDPLEQAWRALRPFMSMGEKTGESVLQTLWSALGNYK